MEALNFLMGESDLGFFNHRFDCMDIEVEAPLSFWAEVGLSCSCEKVATKDFALASPRAGKRMLGEKLALTFRGDSDEPQGGI